MTQPTETCETCANSRPDGIRELYPCNACRVMHLWATASMWRAQPTCATCLHADENRDKYPCCECPRPGGVFALWEARTDQAESGRTMMERAIAAVVADVKPLWEEAIAKLRQVPRKIALEVNAPNEEPPAPERFCYQCRHNLSARTDAPCAGCWTWPGKPNWSPVEITWEPPLYRVDEDGYAHFTCGGTREDPAESEKYHAGLRQAEAELKQWLVPGDTGEPPATADPNLSPPIRTLDAKQCRSVANRFGHQLAVVVDEAGGRRGAFRQCGNGDFMMPPRLRMSPFALMADDPWQGALTDAAIEARRLTYSTEGDRVYLGKLPKQDAPPPPAKPKRLEKSLR